MERLLLILDDIRPDVDFKNETRLISDGILDSFDIITLVEEINSEFEIDIKPKSSTSRVDSLTLSSFPSLEGSIATKISFSFSNISFLLSIYDTSKSSSLECDQNLYL